MITKDIAIDDKKIQFSASGGTARRYRLLFGGDLIREMNTPTGEVDTGTMEQLAYTMMRQANPEETISFEEWLDQFSGLGLYHALPEIIGLWTENTKRESVAKKNRN